MIHLMQLLKMLNKTQRQQFLELFSDLDYELDELEWRGNEADLINGMLFNHFGFSIEDESQLNRIAEVILKPESLKAAVNVVNMN